MLMGFTEDDPQAPDPGALTPEEVAVIIQRRASLAGVLREAQRTWREGTSPPWSLVVEELTRAELERSQRQEHLDQVLREARDTYWAALDDNTTVPLADVLARVREEFEQAGG
jgi:hypothetical protein